MRAMVCITAVSLGWVVFTHAMAGNCRGEVPQMRGGGRSSGRLRALDCRRDPVEDAVVSDVMPFWRVHVEFDIADEKTEAAIRHAAHIEPNFSGGGMGRRDVGWHCNTEFAAQGIARKLRKIGLTPVVRLIAP